ncbi:MAG: TatD family hydrolase [Proteobacteria bacterium]|nr:TatD family hydrolase [Pseudomonadota bacterium]
MVKKIAQQVADVYPENVRLVDVHAHLCHEDFISDMDDLMDKMLQSSIRHVVVNGLEPRSNRVTLELATKYPDMIRPAMGIYPVHAVNHLLNHTDPLRIEDFDLQKAIGAIEDGAASGHIVAVGECGLDGYWFKDREELLAPQEKVFSELVSIATHYDIPVIIHSRKREKRVLEMLSELKAKRVIMHCYMGNVKAALQAATDHGWCFSIPAISQRHHGFAKMLAQLPEMCILTETDSPYLSFTKGERSDPRQVMHVISHLATIREISFEAAATLVWKNYCSVFDL